MSINRYRQLVLLAVAAAVTLSACGSNNVQESNPETVEEVSETLSPAESEDGTDFEVRDSTVMYYDSEETILEGEKIDVADDAEYDLSRLIRVKAYEQAGAKLYAYDYEYEMGDGYQHTGYKFLLEHDGNYQAFDYGIGEMFRYETQESLNEMEFEQGYESDFDDDGIMEPVEFAYYLSGTGSEETDIILFDLNENTEEYDAYIMRKSCFNDLIKQCAEGFFDEYYCSYNNDGVLYVFENGVSAILGSNNRAYMNDAGTIEVAVFVQGSIREDDNFYYDIGSIVFELGYAGEGRFTVKPSRYEEKKNVMAPDTW